MGGMCDVDHCPRMVREYVFLYKYARLNMSILERAMIVNLNKRVNRKKRRGLALVYKPLRSYVRTLERF
jgi:hypothetical protein